MRILTLLLIIISLNCFSQEMGTVSNTTTITIPTSKDSLQVYIPYIYTTELFTKSAITTLNKQEQVYYTWKNGSLVTVSEKLLLNTIAILNARKLNCENVEKELIINTKRLEKLKLLNK
ncbi:MAG TPA: hypothetical protein VIK86_01230 [Candidatus Paceibacterota bacterium]